MSNQKDAGESGHLINETSFAAYGPAAKDAAETSIDRHNQVIKLPPGFRLLDDDEILSENDRIAYGLDWIGPSVYGGIGKRAAMFRAAIRPVVEQCPGCDSVDHGPNYREGEKLKQRIVTPEFYAAAVAIANAWNDPGRAPNVHAAAKNQLKYKWPTLGRAVEVLAEILK